MTAKFYIDSKDAYSQYRVFVTEGGYNELVCYAPLKSVAGNNWQEEDGEEFDLSAPVLDTRELSITFAAHGFSHGLNAFVESLSDMAYHSFEFRDLDRTYKLRLVSQPNLTLVNQLGLVTLRFADDFPLRGYKYKAPNCDKIPLQGYEIDDIDFSKYGVRILQGSLDEIEKSPSVKKNLLRNINSQSGAIYDGETVTFETKDVKINCLMRANTLSEFWQNYDALLYNLIRPNERILYADSVGMEYPCFYKSSSVAKFFPKDNVWFEFSLILTFTSFRVSSDEYILASQSGEYMTTEDNDLIDLEIA